MKLLILGGTIFAGKHLVEAALERGHEVTLFNRGQHGADLFPELEKLRGNRDGDLEALKGRRWDAVIDPSGYVPRLVGDSARLLADAVDHYTFISTISVYASFEQHGQDENAPVGKLEDETVETVSGQTYGPLKALCEQAAEAAMPGRVLTVRPGLIVGPDDPTDRFTYWPVRISRGGEVLAPGKPEAPSQIIDVRDLAAFTLDMMERKAVGIYNATGPADFRSFGEVIETCRDTSGSDARFTWVSDQFLLEQKVAPWTGLPLWIPAGGSDGIETIDCSKAIAAGLTFRPLADTVRDTIAWDATRPADRQWRAGITPEREAELLALWHQQG